MMTEYREETASPQMFGLMNINLVPEFEAAAGWDRQTGGKKGHPGRTATRKGDVAGGFIDPLDWELHLQTVAQQKKNQEEEAVRQRSRMIEHYKAKAGVEMRIQRYEKAATLYSKVLELNSKDTESLVYRAECHYELKQFEAAIQDTMATLGLDNQIAKVYGIQGDCQFQLAQFEEALISYHRAKRIRPGVRQYQQGINRAESVINAAIGESSHTKLQLTGDLSYFDQFSQKNKENPGYTRATRPIQRQSHSASTTKSSARRRDIQHAKTVRQLLEELYGDYSYLEELMQEEDKTVHRLTSNKNRTKQRDAPVRAGAKQKRQHTAEYVRDTVAKEITYLNGRAEFYRHLKTPQPPGESESETGGISRSSSAFSVTSAGELLEMIEEIEADQSQGRHSQSLRKCEKALDFVQGEVYSELPDRDEFEGTLYSLMGNVYFEQEDYLRALEYYEEDLSIAKACKGLEEAESRAMDNIGRVHAKMGQYRKAIEIFEQRLHMAKTPLELTWLHHELGRCYLEIKDTEMALHHSEKALTAAVDAEDKPWQLNALVLKAQALEEAKRYPDALDVFRTGLDLAREDEDRQAQEAIENAIDHIEDKQRRQEQKEQDGVNEGDEAARIKDDVQRSNDEQEELDQKEVRDEIRDLIQESNEGEHGGKTEEKEADNAMGDQNNTTEQQSEAKAEIEESKDKALEDQRDFKSTLLKSNTEKRQQEEAQSVADSIRASNNNNKKMNTVKGAQKVSGSSSKIKTPVGKHKKTDGKTGGNRRKEVVPKSLKNHTSEETKKHGMVKVDTEEAVADEKEGVSKDDIVEEGVDGPEQVEKKVADEQEEKVEKDGVNVKEAQEDENTGENHQMDAVAIRDMIRQSNKENDPNEGSGNKQKSQKDDFYD